MSATMSVGNGENPDECLIEVGESEEAKVEAKTAYLTIPSTHLVGLAWGLKYGLSRGGSYAA